MVKHFCDICGEEGKITSVYLPTLNNDGVSEYKSGNKVHSKRQIGTYQFDLCDRCLGIIAMNIYGMTKICGNTYDE